MSYFRTFPTIDYEYKNQVSKKSIDILRRYQVVDEIIKSNRYETVTVGESETPQSIANNFYNDSKLHWVVLLFNQMINPFYDWPIPEYKLTKRLDSQYPGVSLFITSNQTSDLDSIDVNTKTSNASYQLGETIKVYDDDDDLLDSGTLYEYDRTTGHMKIEDIESFTLGTNHYITDSNGSKKMYIGRKVDIVRDSLKYFLDKNNILVSPYKSFGETKLINLYVNRDDVTISANDINTVSIDRYEKALNDKRRTIKIPDISVVRLISSRIKELNKI